MTGLLERVLCRVFPNQDISHAGSLYLRRWLLTPSVRGWRLMLHRIARPDLERVLHDHPWDFATLCLRGGYDEQVRGPGGIAVEHLRPGAIRMRAAEHAHRIDRIVGTNAWTLVLNGPRRRSWGFWELYADGLNDMFVLSSDYFKDGYDKASPMQRRRAA